MQNIRFFLILIFILSFKNISYSQIAIEADHVILQDHLSGEILFEKDADTKIYPASMTKIMTSIVVFDLLKKGETSLDELITVSEKAWRMSKSGYSAMFIMLNDKVSVEDLLKGLIIVSGNDACVALAEGLAGTEEDFAILMNEKAQEIEMTNSNFSNSSGISDPDNYSTVRDILKMSRYLIKNYPEYYEYYKETSFTWDRTGGDPIKQGNRNPLLYKNMGVDGVKTGFLTVEKYSLAASMQNEDRRLTVVSSGFVNKNKRSSESAKLLNWGIRSFDTIKVASKDEIFDTLDVWLGKKQKIAVVTSEDIYLTVPKRKKSTIKAVIEYSGPVPAPVKKGDKIGLLNIYLKDELIKQVEILANENVKQTNIFLRLLNSLNFLVWGDA
jgi:serine-type D-Ala-D-Ala carboxypeptidase (penicillin-binding protein 5/6)